MFTVREFALAACEPKSMTVCLSGTSYELISDYTGKVDNIMLGLFGDYVIADFITNEPHKYNVWIKEVPVKAEVAV